MGDWSTPTNQVSGFEHAASTVALARLKPTVTTICAPASTTCWISDGYSDALLGTSGVSAVALSVAAASAAPLAVYSLKFLSLIVPISAITAILRSAPDGRAALVLVLQAACGVPDGEPPAEVLGAVDPPAVVAGAFVPVGAVVAPLPPQAPTKSAVTTMAAGPTARIRMNPPPIALTRSWVPSTSGAQARPMAARRQMCMLSERRSGRKAIAR